MKNSLVALFCAVTSFASAQGLPADPVSGKVVYAGTVPVPANATPVQAFGRAKIWLSDAFASKTILSEDAPSGLLSGGGMLVIQKFNYSFRIRLQVEPAAVRYRLDDFTWAFSSSASPADHGTAEEQRDSKLAIGKGSRAKILAELDAKVRAGLAELSKELGGSL